MKIAHFEAASGIAGDMTVASLLDAGRDDGVSLDGLREALSAVPLGHYSLRLSEVEVDGIRALHFDVDIEHSHHTHHRHWSDIRGMLDEGRRRGLPARTYDRAIAIFEVLARAEASVHQVPMDDVHFHEVGAVDSIVDIVGAAWCLDQLGIDACTVSTIPSGSGFVQTEHGRLPVPAPATALLLEGFEVRMGDGEGELVTPTGAAILAAMAKPFQPAMTLDAIGCGAGTMRLRDRPNVLRVFLGTADDTSDEDVVLLEADIDDMTPAALAHACDELRSAGARDVSVLPVQMKKGRLGMNVRVISDYGLLEKLAASLMQHTTSIGVRYRAVHRSVLARRIESVATPYGSMRIKVVVRPDGSETLEPEFEDVARAATGAGKPFVDVRNEVASIAERSMRRHT